MGCVLKGTGADFFKDIQPLAVGTWLTAKSLINQAIFAASRELAGSRNKTAKGILASAPEDGKTKRFLH